MAGVTGDKPGPLGYPGDCAALPSGSPTGGTRAASVQRLHAAVRALVGDVGFLALKANLRPSANFGKRNASDSDSASEKGKSFFNKGFCEREILAFQHSPSSRPGCSDEADRLLCFPAEYFFIIKYFLWASPSRCGCEQCLSPSGVLSL